MLALKLTCDSDYGFVSDWVYWNFGIRFVMVIKLELFLMIIKHFMYKFIYFIYLLIATSTRYFIITNVPVHYSCEYEYCIWKRCGDEVIVIILVINLMVLLVLYYCYHIYIICTNKPFKVS